ncbi:MAG: thermonuclease family protein [Gammaproteobacteria bacterium]|nr:thermonuclease family protein [Gammaproteobacteria bacterium]
MQSRFSRQGAADSVAPFSLWRLLLCSVLLSCPGISAAAGECPAEHIDERAQVIHVFDGDTIKLQDGRRVRLIGINTPEMARDDRHTEPFANEARASLQALLDNNNRTLLLQYGSDTHDHYGRLLAHAFLQNGNNVASMLLKQGLATALVVAPNTWAVDCYQRLEDAARINRDGLWALEKYQARASTALPANLRGFAIVYGNVIGARAEKHGLWIDLDGPLTLHINKRDRVNFSPGYLEQLKGHTVEVRGWIKSDRQGLRMNIQHPAALVTMTPEPG